ncbi:AAA family ATPase [Aureibacillus halotolerans]|uniref:Putative ATPase n=1 Tax=Aureibacillus halotolerans TaxID=1508390 RepID=A0A4V3D4H4_9BACI|nr:AAA family ATPase [Aureibacillus halotolerans]TDQ36267.1 putative ATPase [Aureibacillus halotolerans]
MVTTSSYLKHIDFHRRSYPHPNEYPFNLPSLKDLDQLKLHPAVTFIIGENGMGKSTLIEAIAIAWGFNPEGGTKNFSFASRETHSELHRYIRLVKTPYRPKDGFFFRAESYYNVASQIDKLDSEFSYSPPIRHSYGGKSLHEQSHGESFFATFMNRLGGDGLYIMDEPEAALSPLRQMAMLARIHELVVEKRSQFIISTHSPILMAYPNATLYWLTRDGLEVRKWQETDHYNIMKQFVNRPDMMMNELFNEKP